MTPAPTIDELKLLYRQQMAAIEQTFTRTSDGNASIRRRTSLVDRLLLDLVRRVVRFPAELEGIALVATGGYGRRELFPCSDVDLLLLCRDEGCEKQYREQIGDLDQAMWDLGLRASVQVRTLRECEAFDADNLEFTLALLDRRYLAGSSPLYQRLQNEVLPAVVMREWNPVAQKLAEIARARHEKFGNTIFHLEPNLKDSPGGLRDYHFAQWFLLLNTLRETGEWPRQGSGGFSTPSGDAEAAFEFLAAVRCFLHFRQGRDDNTLSWQAQDEAAAQSVGLETGGTADPAYWMRTYYRHARTIYRRASLLMESLPPARSSFYRQFRRRRAPIPGTEFFVEQGRIDIGEFVEVTDADSTLRVFTSIAAHGYRLSQNAEDRILESLPTLAVHMPEGPYLWNCLREVLLGPHAAGALRTMHALGILELLIPEFHGIDALVIRDTYHRYTVDEHTFLVIDGIHRLRQPARDWERPFASLLPEIDRMDLFLLALLLHDTGKARRSGDHTEQSVELAESLLARLDLDSEERETVRRLIRNHLEMSAALRRDIFDPESIRQFGEKIADPVQLKMLTLMTFADIKAVNPEALTPWKAENLWQLYISTANFLDRSVDEVRYHSELDPTLLYRIRSLVPERAAELKLFLEGLPQRYLQTRPPEQIRKHFLMAGRLDEDPVQLELAISRQLYELTVVTRDRRMLFADLAGALAAWGMNIVKADAFSNEQGVIVDSFHFTDAYRTLELNPGERDHFLASVKDVVAQRVAVESLLASRRPALPAGRAGSGIRLEFDTESSSHSTLLQVVAPDARGLLRHIALALASCGCNLEVALVDTEGETAIDVFYLTAGGRKLDAETRARVEQHLGRSLRALQLPAVV